MTHTTTADDILERFDGEAVHSGDRFRRLRGTAEVAGTTPSVVRDVLPAHEIEHWTLSLPVERVPDDGLTLRGLSEHESVPGLAGETEAGRPVWLPTAPVARRYDPTDHVRAEATGTMRTTEHGVVLRPPGVNDLDTLEFAIVVDTGDGDLIENFVDRRPLEDCSLIKARWFDYDGPTTFWTYFIDGRVYDPRSKGNGRWPCQQCAHSLFLHLLKLGQVTDKRLYLALAELVAHSVALSLPEDGRWRHGVWTNDGETHARFQTDGVHLLLTAYNEWAVPKFLDAATEALEYLVSIADTLSQGELWFAHDSLEQSESQHSKHYGLRPTTTVLGKRPSNTICLNTHVWTVVALRRAADIMKDEDANGSEEYERLCERSLAGLHRVLSLRRASRAYRLANRGFDAIDYGDQVPNFVRRLADRPSEAALILLKNLFPRLVMPGGRIERDLSHTGRSDFYHLQNLKDLSVLNTYLDDEMITDVIRRGLAYIEDVGLVQNMLPEDRRAVMILDVLFIASLCGQDQSELIREYAALLDEHDVNLSADVISFGPTLANTVQKAYDDHQTRLFPDCFE